MNRVPLRSMVLGGLNAQDERIARMDDALTATMAEVAKIGNRNGVAPVDRAEARQIRGPEMPPVAVDHDRLEGVVHGLHADLSELEERLSVVLSPAPPIASGTAAAAVAGGSASGGSVMSRHFAAFSEQVSDARGRLRRVLDRLEV